MMNNPTVPSRSLSIGLALTTCATLLLEITYTRIFSVTMWYHFAFMAISVAMFGMSFGAVITYVRPKWFPQERIHDILGRLGFLFALSVVVTFWVHLQIPFIPTLTFLGLTTVLSAFALITIPFVLSGILVSLVLTRFPGQVGRLYAVDLIGAAIGCLLLWVLMRPLTGPGMVLFGAFLAATGGAAFTWGRARGPWRKLVWGLAGLLLIMTLLQPHFRLLRIKWVKNVYGSPMAEPLEEAPMVEVWNSHSVITVFHDLLKGPFAWGMSTVYKPQVEPQQVFLTIDAAAGTVITKYTGKESEIRHLRYDVTALAHHLRPESDVLVIGTGGGRDILMSLLANPKRVTGVEINRDILKLINDTLGSFTGHLDQHKKVRFINDEARSWIERSDERFDVIQASLIDSWAATSAGAFVLTENSLYTEEGWTEFLNHLTEDRGVLTMSRWWMSDRPGEMIRCTSLAYAALRNIGAENPRDHVLIATTDYDADMVPPEDVGGTREGGAPNGVGTIIVSRRPLTKADIDTFEEICKRYKFQVLLTPRHAGLAAFADVLDPATHTQAIADFDLDISPPTDDSPFFFNMLRFSDVFSLKLQDQWVTSFNVRAVAVLVLLFVLMTLLSALGLFVPLWLHERGQKREPLPRGMLFRHALYFSAIGLSFILVEIGTIQRLTLFLGHPVYSLAVVLFSILLATGLGSWLTGRWFLEREGALKHGWWMIVLAFVVTLAAALGLPALLSALHGSPLTPRIFLSIGLMFLLGVPMGAAFPIGLHCAGRQLKRATPWLWAINGALSVTGSVLAMIISIGFGITATCLVGALGYFVALAVLKRNIQDA